MARKQTVPISAAIRVLRAAKVDFEPHLYDYVEKGGTGVSSTALGVDEHQVIKTLIFEDENKKPLVALMHGDLQVANGVLAKLIGAKKINACRPEIADRHSGYQVGGTSPFGLKAQMPIYAQASIQNLNTIYINGGKRGFLVSMNAMELERVLKVKWLDFAQPRV